MLVWLTNWEKKNPRKLDAQWSRCGFDRIQRPKALAGKARNVSFGCEDGIVDRARASKVYFTWRCPFHDHIMSSQLYLSAQGPCRTEDKIVIPELECAWHHYFLVLKFSLLAQVRF